MGGTLGHSTTFGASGLVLSSVFIETFESKGSPLSWSFKVALSSREVSILRCSTVLYMYSACRSCNSRSFYRCRCDAGSGVLVRRARVCVSFFVFPLARPTFWRRGLRWDGGRRERFRFCLKCSLDSVLEVCPVGVADFEERVSASSVPEIVGSVGKVIVSEPFAFSHSTSKIA